MAQQQETNKPTEEELYCFVDTTWMENSRSCEHCTDVLLCKQLFKRWEKINHTSYPEPWRSQYPFNKPLQKQLEMMVRPSDDRLIAGSDRQFYY